MPQLTDLPNELLLNIFPHCFVSIGSKKDINYPLLSLLNRYILSKRLYFLAHKSFYETFICEVTITPDIREWDQGTLLHDIYSPTFTHSGGLRNNLDFVTRLQNLEILLWINDDSQINTGVHEVMREIKRYPRLKKVYVVVSNAEHGVRTALLAIQAVASSALKGVKLFVEINDAGEVEATSL